MKEKDVTRRSDKKKTRTPKVSSDDFADQDEIHRNAKSSYTNLVGRRLSWTTVNTLDLLEPLMNVLQGNRRIAESFKVLMKPPDFDLEDIQRSLYTFITSLPDYVPRVKHDKTFQLFKSIRKLLKSKECVQLYGLLIHFCYWNIIHPTARHTIQSLRERGLSKPTGVFDDLDLSTQGMLQVRNQTGAQSSSAVPTGQHSALSVERMFAEGMLSVADDGVEMIQVHDPACSPSYYQHQHQHEEQISSNSSSSSRMNSRSRTCSGSGGYDIHIADGLQALEASSRPGSPEFGVSANGSDKLGFSSRPSSPDHDGTNGSKKVDFNLSRSVHSRSPIMGNRSMDAGFEDGNGSVEGSLNGSITGGAYGGSPTARTRFPNGGGGGSLSGVSVETEASLSAFEKEQLFVHLEACLIHLFKKVKYAYNYIPFS